MKSKKCWRCGKAFIDNDKKLKKTAHHAIPQFLRAKKNIVIPICLECHEEINRYFVKSIPQLKEVYNFMKHLKKFIDKYETKLSKYQIKKIDDVNNLNTLENE